MDIQRHTISVSTSIGSVSAESVVPQSPKAVYVLAHGAGAGMDHRFMVAFSNTLADHDVASVRFNFPFTEQRKNRPDPPAVATKTIGAAIEFTHSLLPGIPLFAGGKSFGGRMSSQYVAKDHPENVRGLVFIGFPLHPAGAPSIERATHLNDVTIPMLFLQGTRDALATKDLITQVSDSLSLADLIWFEGADHSFKAGKKDNIAELSQAAASWMIAH